jgi:predicted Zn-dependent peptidase
MTSFIVYPPNVKESDLLAAYDAVIADLSTKGPSQPELERISAKMRSDWYSQLEIPISRASVLAHATLFDGNPQRVNEIPDELAKVRADEVKAFARKYLVKTNRTYINRVPAPASEKQAEGGESRSNLVRICTTPTFCSVCRTENDTPVRPRT